MRNISSNYKQLLLAPNDEDLSHHKKHISEMFRGKIIVKRAGFNDNYIEGIERH